MTVERLQDADVREQALDCSQSFIVQAPAGSGKTGLLTRRFLRLLASVKRPEEIVAITFTRKAAAEMRSRIFESLKDAANGIAPKDEFAGQIQADARLALAQDARLGWGLLESPMRLQIQTVDALNSRLVTAMPVTARAARVRIVESEQLKQLYRDAIELLLDWLTEKSEPGDAVRRVLRHLDAHTGVWATHLLGMLATREQWLPQLLHSRRQSLESLRENSENALAEMVLSEVRALDALFPKHCRTELLELMQGGRENMLTRNPHDPLAHPLPTQWPMIDAESVDFWRMLASWCLTKGDTFRKRMTVNEGFPPADKPKNEAFMAIIGMLAEVDGLAEQLAMVRAMPDAHYDDAQWATIAALIELLPIAAAELQRLMAERGVADYPALAARAIDALVDDEAGRITDLALHLDYRIQHILVDEMQDTSATQYRLVDALTAGWEPDDGRTLFCVGDPMQSIYRFRGANVSLFQQAREQGVGNVILTPLVLRTNFRSSAPVIEWVNRTFAEVMGNTTDRTTDAVAYSASLPRPGAPAKGDVQWHIGLDAAAPTEDDVVTLIADIQRQHPGDTIGVLARSRAPLQAILAGLQRAGVACQALDMDRLTDLPEVIDLLCLTHALEHVGDRTSWLGVLRSPLIGMSMRQIDDMLVRAESGDTPPLSVLAMLTDERCVAALDAHTQYLLRRFLDAYWRAHQEAATRGLRERVEHLWCSLGGPASLPDAAAIENAWHYLDALQGLELDGQLNNIAELESLLDDLQVSRNAPDARVFAMTIFKSKGLEFDHVILPELQRTTKKNTAPPLFLEVSETADGAAILFSADTPRAQTEKDPLHGLLWRREQARFYNELDRVLYVACTRARRGLHLFASGGIRSDGETLKTPPADTLLRRMWPMVEADFQALATDADAVETPEHASAPEWLMPHRRQISPPWSAPEVALPGEQDLRFSIPPNQNPIEFDWAGSSARHIGTVVHGWLQYLAGSDDIDAAFAGIDDFEQRSVGLLRYLGVDNASLEQATRRVSEALSVTLSSEKGRWLLSNRHDDSAAELALGALIDGRVGRVVIDRIARDSDGTLWIVDYKTSQHEGGDIETFFANECERYRSQLLRYRTAVTGHFAARERQVDRVQLALFFTNYGRLERVSA